MTARSKLLVNICTLLLTAHYSLSFTATNPLLDSKHLAAAAAASGASNSGVLLSVTAKPSNDGLSEAEALLAKARELRAQAEAAESQLHATLIEKKTCMDVETDSVIEDLFPFNVKTRFNMDKGKGDTKTAMAEAYNNTVTELAEKLERKKLSKDMLLRVVERLHNREIAARGLECVEPSLHHTHVKFERVASPNKEELDRVSGLIDLLVEAATVLDTAFLSNQMARRGENGRVVMHVVDHSHWSSGELSKVLRERAKFLGREHDEQFKNRLEEFYEAARKKDKKKGSDIKP